MATNNLPPIPQDEIGENFKWRDWFKNLGSYIQNIQLGNLIIGIAQGGTGATTASGARHNLGLGSIATQDSTAVAITGGSISGINIPYTDITGLATVAHTGAYSDLTGKPTLGTMAAQNVGINATITTAKLTTVGTTGSMTFTNGILTSQTQAT